MKVLLLAAGYGTRLRPLTLKTPKCLVPIKGIPLLTLWINKINNVFKTEIYVNTHYLANEVEKYLKQNHPKVNILYEKKLLGTAGTIFNSKSIFKNDDLLIIHADNYSEDNLQNFKEILFECKKKNIPLLMAFKTNHPKECGILSVDKNNILNEFIEKPDRPKGNLANCGVYYFPKKIINNILNKNNYLIDLSTELIPKLINYAQVYITNDLYIDIGTPEKYNLVK